MNLATAGVKAEKLISRFAPDAVIGTGGYICYPILKKAAQMGLPTIVHESNAVPGLTTKLLSASVDRVLISFPGLEGLYRRPERVVFTGTPVRSGFMAPAAVVAAPAARVKPLVVSFWGSLGAELIRLNIGGGRFRHIHATGGKAINVGGALPQDIEIREYIDDMPALMAAADIILCRAGASTIAELTAAGKPAVLVPSPYVTNNHQEENAKQLQKAGGAVMLLEKGCTGEKLYDTVASILEDADKLKSMSAAQKALGIPDAAGKIVEMIIAMC
jgi:UDP-N-acetylglucosamine--N-acetylmuramyl-(pentapeptide) pyrophosphoryl-undecaprenol N-acetylglucosamine transferase